MIQINDVVVSLDVLQEKFLCNLDACKGGHVQMALGGGAWIECCYGYGVAVNMSNAWMESRPCYYFRYAGF